MKRTLTLLACLVAVAVVVAAYGGSRLSAKAEAPARPAPPKQPRIAILNLRFIVKNYKKYKAFMEEVKRLDEKYVNEVKAKNKEADKLQKRLTETTDEEKREQIQKSLRRISNEIKEISESARKEMGRRGEKEMVLVYKEIRDVAIRHAKANKIDLVLKFNGAADKEERDSPILIKQNFNDGACPIYWEDSLDISEDILKALNDAFDRSVRAPASH